MSTLTLPLEQNGEKRCGTQESDPRTEKNDPTYFLVSVQGFWLVMFFPTVIHEKVVILPAG